MLYWGPIEAERMIYIREKLVEASDFDATRKIVEAAFFEAAAAGQLEAFRTEMRGLLLEPPTSFCVPYAFAYEARGFLHDPSMWIEPTNGGAYAPKPELLAVLEACLGRTETINCRDNYYWLIISGLAEFVRGRVPAAFRQFALAATYPDFYRVVTCDMGGAAFAKTYPNDAELTAQRVAPKFDRNAHFVREFATKLRVVISISFDWIYARAFALGWIKSVAALAAHGVGLHFHIVFRSAPDEAMLSCFVAEAKRLLINLAISIETRVQHERAYFACVRFLKGVSFMHHFDAPLILVDADAFIPDPPLFRNTHLPRIVSETRILGLLADGPWMGYLPWRRFSATWMLCPNRPDVAEFLRKTADAIEYFWDERGRNWWIDQMSLEVGRRSVIAQMANPPVFGQIFHELPGLFKSTEDYKISEISKLPEIQQRIEAGKTYWEAYWEVVDAHSKELLKLRD
jgi:hypothetical protein